MSVHTSPIIRPRFPSKILWLPAKIENILHTLSVFSFFFYTYSDEFYAFVCDKPESQVQIDHLVYSNPGLLHVASDLLLREDLHESYENQTVTEIIPAEIL